MAKSKYIYPGAHKDYLEEDFRYWLVLNMERSNVTPSELANRMDKNITEIYQLLQGRRIPYFSTIVEICNGLGVTIDKFFSNDIFDSNKLALRYAEVELNNLYLTQGYITKEDINKAFGLPDALKDDWRYEK